MVIVPFWSSTGPVLSNCTGPTRLWLTVDGGGPKYARPTLVPIEAGAGNRLQPGPGPMAPPPGPCAWLGSTAVGVVDTASFFFSMAPGTARRGVRSRGESCAKAAALIVRIIPAPMTRDKR